MTFDEYSNFDACGLAELVQRKEVAPIELLELAIARAEEVNPRINAIVVPCYDQARAEVARLLNRVCGCSVFHVWNVDLVPDVDVRCLLVAMEVGAEYRG